MTTALQLLKLLDSRHAELEREAGRRKAHTRGYDRAMGELGWFLAELPDLARLVPFVGASLQNGTILISEPSEAFALQAVDPIQEYLVRGVSRGRSVDDLLDALNEFQCDEEPA